MKQTLIFLLLSLFSLVLTNAQDREEVLLTVGNETVSRFEFEQIYLKNNQMVEETDRKSLDQYLELFIIYKLKVAEAKAQGLQHSNEFKQELDGYRKQLVQPYLVDKITEEKLLREAYERMKLEVNASHILIAVPDNSTPEDTLLLYNKALNIRNRIVEGEPFEAVARATSDDPSVKANGGNLGFFSAFQMVYPFESAAFTTPVGKLSMPFRTRFGYHVVRVNDKRASKGQVRTSHIMLTVPQNASAEKKAESKELIDSIYSIVLSNEDFGKLAKAYSQDPGTAQNGGELPWFGLRQMPPEFERVAFALEKPGDVGKPIQTQFGWHIIKLLEKRNVGDFDQMMPELRTRIARDERSRVSRSVFIQQIKDKNGFEIDSNAIQTMAQLLDSSVYKGEWNLPEHYKSRFLFGFAGKIHTLSELAEKIKQNSTRIVNIPFAVIVERLFNDLVTEIVLSFEEERLIAENPEIRYLLKEYHDGILLFEIMDQNVWNRSTHDQEGLEKFYNSNLQRYSWDKRIYAQRFESKNQRILKKVLRYITSRRGSGATEKQVVERFISRGDTLLTISKVVELSDNKMIKDYKSWENGISSISSANGEYYFVRFNKEVENDPKRLEDIKGQVIADYQQYLEEEWIKVLRNKHTVKVYKDVYSKIISNQN